MFWLHLGDLKFSPQPSTIRFSWRTIHWSREIDAPVILYAAGTIFVLFVGNLLRMGAIEVILNEFLWQRLIVPVFYGLQGRCRNDPIIHAKFRGLPWQNSSGIPRPRSNAHTKNIPLITKRCLDNVQQIYKNIYHNFYGSI